MVSVSELVVAIRGDGIEQTEQDLEGMNETVQESSESMGEQAGMMEELGAEFAGAMGTAIAGLAVASAGLLSQVPVLGTLFSGLMAIVNAVALTMDQVLRPVLEPIANKMFDLAAAISENMDGSLGTLVGILATMATVISGLLLGPIGVLGSLLGGLGVGALLALVNFEKFKQGLATVAAFVSKNAPKAFKKLKKIAVNAITTLAAKMKKNLPKILQKLIEVGRAIVDKLSVAISRVNFNKAGSDIMRFIIDAVTKFIRFASDIVTSLMDVVEKEFKGYTWEQFGKDVIKLIADAIKISVSFISGAVGTLVDKIVEIVEETDWVEVGSTIVEMIAKGIKAASNFLSGVAEALASEIRQYLPFSPAETGPLSDLDKTGPALVDEFASGISSNKGQVGKAASGMVGEAKQSGGSQLPSPRKTTPKIILDGREVGRGTGGERFDESARRGQTF